MSSDWGSTTQEPGKFSDEMCLEEKDWEWDTGHRDKWRKEREKKRNMLIFLQTWMAQVDLTEESFIT